MIWSAIVRCLQPYFSPLWIEARRVSYVRGVGQRPAIYPLNSPRRLFIDVSVICKHDAGTGIQRVVRTVASQLLANTWAGWQVHAVNAKRHLPFHTITWPSDVELSSSDPIDSRPGDVFFGLDYSFDAVCRHEVQLTKFKILGGQLWFVVHDLLPIQRPEWFSDKTVVRYRKWLRVIASLGDGFFCNSSQTEKELREQLFLRYRLDKGFRTVVLPMGWDLATYSSSKGLPENFDLFLNKLDINTTVLMVGTIEPRKAHDEVIAAFDILWKRNCKYNLVIVGRAGWKTTYVQALIRSHPRLGDHLFWLDNASDEALEKLYIACDGVIVSSHAEGFGLPLVEAVGYEKPVLARDLPVFRLLQENPLISYFSSDANVANLACSIDQWTRQLSSGTVEVSGDNGRSSWEDTAKAVMSSLN